jgi:hypothetical protein
MKQATSPTFSRTSSTPVTDTPMITKRGMSPLPSKISGMTCCRSPSPKMHGHTCQTLVGTPMQAAANQQHIQHQHCHSHHRHHYDDKARDPASAILTRLIIYILTWGVEGGGELTCMGARQASETCG